MSDIISSYKFTDTLATGSKGSVVTSMKENLKTKYKNCTT